jgi:integrase
VSTRAPRPERKRAPNGAGTLYKEDVPGRQPRWVSEAYVNLPDGRRKRVRGRGPDAEAAISDRMKRVRALEEDNPDLRRLTVAQLAARWTEARSPAWRASTIASYRTMLDRHILPVIGDYRVARLGSLDAQQVLGRILRVSENKHVAAANRARRTMHALFAFARESGLIRENPIDGVRSIRLPEKERGWWTRAQALAFLTACGRSPYRDLFHAAITSGLRLGELLALRWRDVDERGFTVRRTYSAHVPGKIQDAPKSRGSVRTVPVPASLSARLEPRRGRADALVFASRTGKVLNPSNVNRALRRYAIAAEVPILTAHDLRRTYASMLAEAGYSPKVIQRLLGHATVDLALRVYTSVSDAAVAGAVLELGGDFGGSVTAHERPSAVLAGVPTVPDVAPDTLN